MLTRLRYRCPAFATRGPRVLKRRIPTLHCSRPVWKSIHPPGQTMPVLLVPVRVRRCEGVRVWKWHKSGLGGQI